MAAPYTPPAVSGYNSSPPADDGSQTTANRLKWSTIKTKLSDPLNTQAGAQNSALQTAFGKVMGGAGVVTTAINYDVSTTNQSGLVVGTASSITITTPDAADVGSPFLFQVLNRSAGDITLDGFGSQTINSLTSLTLPSGEGLTIWTDGSNWYAVGRRTGSLPRGYIDGCILANNGSDATNDIDIAAGVCRDSTNTVDITCAAMTKQLDANWVAGTNQGFRNSAAGIANTTYHIYAVATAAGVQDYYAHTSATVATVLTALQLETGGASYIYARRIGSIVRASAAILPFFQVCDDFYLLTAIRDYSNATPGTSRVTTALGSVPGGIRVIAKINVNVTGSYAYFAPVGTTDVAPDTNNAPLSSLGSDGANNHSGNLDILTDTSRQICFRVFSDVGVRVATLGWRDFRGRDAA